MKSLKIPMTWEEYEISEYPFGWKNEYWDGFARLSPRQTGVLQKIPVEKRDVETSAEILPIQTVSREELAELFYVTFVDSVEYCNWKKSAIRQTAHEEIENFFEGRRGIPQIELSRIAVLPKRKKKLVGACLVSKYKYGFKNEILFVRPNAQRKNIGTALVASILNDLHKLGEKIFWSEYIISNNVSASWHRKFGFLEEPDLMTASLRRNYFYHEVQRHEKLENYLQAAEAKSLLDIFEAEVERLEKIKKESFEAAYLSWRYDF